MGTSLILFLVLACVGHAVWLTWLLNNLYGRPIPKKALKLFRLFIGIAILALPALLIGLYLSSPTQASSLLERKAFARGVLWLYLTCMVVLGGIVFPVLSLVRFLRKPPSALVRETSRTVDLWPELGHKLIGDGHWNWLPRLPLNHLFRVDFTEWTLELPRLPAQWDGMTILLMSDFHFHGTPSHHYFQRIIDEIQTHPTPDVVALLGDFVDTHDHHDWIRPLLGQLQWKECGLAILGNHDAHFEPDRVRLELSCAGYEIFSDRVGTLSIRGVPCTILGLEGPWLPASPVPEIEDSPFTLALSHTPDNIYRLQRARPDLVLCGHVHGGQIRLPVIGSIFVPSVYSRRFDMGVHQVRQSIMAISRGLSGREPLRYRCHPQVVRITLRGPASTRVTSV